MLGNIVYQLRIANGGRVNGNFVGTGIEQAVYVTQFVDPSPNGKRNTDIGSNPPDQFGKSLTPFMTGGNIKKHQFVGSLLAIGTPQFYRIAGLAQVYEIRPFHGLPVFDIETRYNSFC